MSLRCGETRRDILFGEPLMAVTRDEFDWFTAVSQEVLARIPESEKFTFPREPGDGGLDIHEATSVLNDTGSYSLFEFKLGRFRYSISQETAKEYMPKIARMFALESAN